MERLGLGGGSGGEDNAEGGAFAHLALDFDAALVVFDDFFADCQTQSRAADFLATGGGFGSEEGLEDSRLKVLGNAGAGIDDVDFYFVFLDGAGLYRQAPPRPSMAWRALIMRLRMTCSS